MLLCKTFGFPKEGKETRTNRSIVKINVADVAVDVDMKSKMFLPHRKKIKS